MNTLHPFKLVNIHKHEYMWMQNSTFFAQLLDDHDNPDIDIYIPVCKLTTNNVSEFARTISAILCTTIPYHFLHLYMHNIPDNYDPD